MPERKLFFSMKSSPKSAIGVLFTRLDIFRVAEEIEHVSQKIPSRRQVEAKSVSGKTNIAVEEKSQTAGSGTWKLKLFQTLPGNMLGPSMDWIPQRRFMPNNYLLKNLKLCLQSSPELRALAAKLELAYINKERAAQVSSTEKECTLYLPRWRRDGWQGEKRSLPGRKRRRRQSWRWR